LRTANLHTPRSKKIPAQPGKQYPAENGNDNDMQPIFYYDIRSLKDIPPLMTI
jgi:hypothetical protein